MSGSGNNCWINYFYQLNSSFLVTASSDRCRLKSSAAPNLPVESAVIRDTIAHKKNEDTLKPLTTALHRVQGSSSSRYCESAVLYWLFSPFFGVFVLLFSLFSPLL